MATFNNIQVIARLGADPEIRLDGKLCLLRLAIQNKKKDQSGDWIDDTIWIDAEAWNSERRKLADVCADYLKKGHQVFISGQIRMDSWEDKNGGGKRTKHKILVFDVQFLKPKGEEQPQNRSQRAQTQQQPQRPPQRSQQPHRPAQPQRGRPAGQSYQNAPDPFGDDYDIPPGRSSGDDDIPF